MNKIDIENVILKKFYEHWEGHSGNTVYAVFGQLDGIEETSFSRVAEELEEKNLINGVGQSISCNITCFGIQETENRGLIESEKVNRYREIRYIILEALSKVFEKEGRYGTLTIVELMEENEFEEVDLYNNIEFLNDFGLLEAISIGMYQSTQLGIEQFRLWEQGTSLNEEFANLSKLSPQKRGTELQKVIAKALGFAGWKQEESVKTSYEEVDVIIHKNREFCLIECKWEKNPIQPIAINHLLGKLNKRADTKGIVMSMSGFTSGAVQDVIDSTTQKLIILFGKKDIEEIISNPDSFEILLNEKYTELISRRTVVWK
ncbi:MAG TPA: restriction endonuclease [Pyrinomonadaceae bacterium]|nr:restriction endonuclease [Pyrinomonadaceae bacterium]